MISIEYGIYKTETRIETETELLHMKSWANWVELKICMPNRIRSIRRVQREVYTVRSIHESRDCTFGNQSAIQSIYIQVL